MNGKTKGKITGAPGGHSSEEGSALQAPADAEAKTSARRHSVLGRLSDYLFIAFFAVLFTERLIAVIAGFVELRPGGGYAFLYLHIVNIIAVAAAAFFASAALPEMLKAQTPVKAERTAFFFRSLAAGALLFVCIAGGGRVLPVMQIIGSCALIASLAARSFSVAAYRPDFGRTRQAVSLSFISLYLFALLTAYPGGLTLLQTAADGLTLPQIAAQSALAAFGVCVFTFMYDRFTASGGKVSFNILVTLSVAALPAGIMLIYGQLSVPGIVFAALALAAGVFGRIKWGGSQAVSFAGGNTRRDYFEGWYVKMQKGDTVVAFIPSFHIFGGKKFCNLQVITPGRAYSYKYDISQFNASKEAFGVNLGGLNFSLSGVEGFNAEAKINANIAFGAPAALRGDIMGFFGAFPLMECRHGVLSMRHTLSGKVEIDGSVYDFDGGTGYIEKDAGSSFPSGYTWTQGTDGQSSVMVSVAAIPYLGLRFRGIIAAAVHNGRQYRLATYNFARLKEYSAKRIAVSRGRTLLEVLPIDVGEPLELDAPKSGAMMRVVRESPAAVVRYRLTKRGKTLFDFTTAAAGYETDGETVSAKA